MTFATWGEQVDHNQIKYLDELTPRTYLFVYTFNFKMNIPGTNMHLGNSVFDYINHNSTELTYVALAATKPPTPAATVADVNCLTSDWSEKTTCSKSCGSAGVTKQYRMVITEASGAGTPCGDLVKEEPCDEGVVCPVDCEMNAWPDPSVGECDKTCVTGANDVSTRTQTRTVKTASVAGGDSCPTGVTNEVGAVETNHRTWGSCGRHRSGR